MNADKFLKLPAIVRIPAAVVMLAIGMVVLAPLWIAAKLGERFASATRISQQRFGSAQAGQVDNRIAAIVSGVITLVIGMVLASTVNSQAATLGSNANIGSFTGAQAIGDLIPLVYIAAILMVGVALIALGATGFGGFGPMGSR